MEKDKLTAQQTRKFLDVCIGEKGRNHLPINHGEYLKLLTRLRINGKGVFNDEAMKLLNEEADRARLH